MLLRKAKSTSLPQDEKKKMWNKQYTLDLDAVLQKFWTLL